MTPAELLREVKRIELTTRELVRDLVAGDYTSTFRGRGVEFAEVREYLPGDDVRTIDWNVTARLGVPHVREYHEDRDLTAWFLVDLSPSSEIGANTSRATMALDFVATLARLLAHRGNRVGALRYRQGVDAVVMTGSGRRHVLRLIHQLLQPGRATPRRGRTPAPAGTRLHELLEAAQPPLKRRSQVFVVSDFLSEPGWETPLARLAQRHDVVAVRLTDPLDGELPDLGLLLMGDAETGEQILVDTHDRRFRARHAEAVERREAALQAALGGAGVDALELSSNDDLAEALLHFVRLRRRVAQRLAGGAVAGVRT